MTAKSPPRARQLRGNQAGDIGLSVAAAARSRKRTRLLLWACIVLGSSSDIASAQTVPTDAGTPQGAGTPAAPPPAPPAVRTPPEVVRLEPILIEDPALVTTDTLEVFVRIGADGHAQLDDARPAGALRVAVESALANSEFRPAQIDGTPVDARVRIAWQLSARAEPPLAAPEPFEAEANPKASIEGGPEAPPIQLSEESVSYEATGRIQLLQPTRKHFEPREVRELPGALGDPFRLADALPGVVPALSGLPYVYVRGAPPASTNYYYDGIQVPLLYHLALGPAVVHPALIGPVDFYAAVAPARYGRHTGGVLAGASADPPFGGELGGELELRLIDVMGMLNAPIGDGALTVGARYGYPGLIVSLFSPETSLAYWDYQVRFGWPLSAQDRFELVWFGSYDSTDTDQQGAQPDEEDAITLEFHRAELRLIHEAGRLEFGSALQVGYDRSEIQDGLTARSLRLGPRAYAQWHDGAGLRLRAGADLIGIAGEVTVPVEQQEASLGITTPLYEDVAARSTMGAYAELHAPILPSLLIDAGLRGDLWMTGSRPEAAVDPRLTLTLRALPWLAFHVAGGLAHQPAVFLIPLPGIADVGFERGLQRAIQSEAGVAVDLPMDLRVESQAYLQYFTNMIFPDLAIEQSEECSSLPGAVAMMTERCNGGYPRADVWAYGVELFLRRSTSQPLSGWLSYTLGWSHGESEDGVEFTPSFDVRHIGNLVLQWRFAEGFVASSRLHYRTGKMAAATFPRERPIRYEQRLPGFFRMDLMLSYGWITGFGNMRVALEWFNATLSREAINIECEDGVLIPTDPSKATPCRIRRAPALFFPNLGVRAEF